MEKNLSMITNLLKKTNLPDKDIALLAMFIDTLDMKQIDAVLTVLWDISWNDRLIDDTEIDKSLVVQYNDTLKVK